MLPVLPVAWGLIVGGADPRLRLVGFRFGCILASAIARRHGKLLLKEDVNDAVGEKIENDLDSLRKLHLAANDKNDQISGVRHGTKHYVPSPGDHIRVRCWFGPVPYHHHGIVGWDCENHRPTAIHYDSGMDEGGIKRRKKAAAVRESSLDRFAGSAGRDAIELVERPQDAQAVLTRAYSALGSELWAEGTYNLLSNNCEHFARWCVGGWGYSQQVTNFSILRSGIGATVSEFSRRLWTGTIGRIAARLGLGSLIPGIGWLFLEVGIVSAGYELAKGLDFFCNGQRTEIDGKAVRRAALANGVEFV